MSQLYLEGVAYVEDVLYLASGTGIAAALDTLQDTADARQALGHPPEFIRGIHDSVAVLRQHYGLAYKATQFMNFN